VPLLATVRAALSRLVPPGHSLAPRVVVAVSGGPDSLCMLHALVQLRGDHALELHVAHLDHLLRGEESAADAAFVAATAAAWGLPVHLSSRDVAARARERRIGSQAAGRELRYAFLAELARDLEAHVVAVGHTADDQAETLLLHLLRGAGPAGLRGMRAALPWSEWAGQKGTGAPLIRPLLEVSRAEIERYLAAQGLAPRRDPSNAAPRYLRSRIRHELLPGLASYNPQIAGALARSAQICADDYDFVQGELDARWPELARVSSRAVRLDRELFGALHPALRRYALRRAVEELLGTGVALGFAQIEAAAEAALGPVGGRLELPAGLRLDVVHGTIAISRGALHPEAEFPQLAAEWIELPGAGAIYLGNGWIARVGRSEPAATAPRVGLQVQLDAGQLQTGLALRPRKPGDRMRTQAGSRRLQDLMVDHKLPRELRAAWPLLVSGETIVWVPGIAADARYLVTEATRDIVYIELDWERE
jgi:tRNA(Ile)-lysidine synthase